MAYGLIELFRILILHNEEIRDFPVLLEECSSPECVDIVARMEVKKWISKFGADICFKPEKERHWNVTLSWILR
jgi:hypothetical protein